MLHWIAMILALTKSYPRFVIYPQHEMAELGSDDPCVRGTLCEIALNLFSRERFQFGNWLKHCAGDLGSNQN
jgi:hypothetical protein